MNDLKDLKNVGKQKAKKVLKKAEHKTSSAYETVKDNAEYFANQAQDALADVYAGGKKKVEQAYDVSIEKKDSFIELIKEKPVFSVLIAAGIGYLISELRKK